MLRRNRKRIDPSVTEFQVIQNANPDAAVEPAAISKTSIQQSAKEKPARRNRGLSWKCGFFLFALIGILGWCAPFIIATTELRNHLPKLLFPDCPGTIEFGETSLGWASPIVIKNFRAADQDGQPLLEIGQFSTSETLWTLVAQRTKLGTFRIVEPVIHISLLNGDSNVERLLAKWTGAGTVSGYRVPDFAVEIENARLEFDEQDSKRQSKIDQISLRMVSANGGLDLLDLAVGSKAASGAESANTDWIAARFGNPINDGDGHPANVKEKPTTTEETGTIPESQPKDDSTASAGTRHFVLRASHWKLDRLAVVLSRFLPNAEFGGELTADATVVLTPTESGLDCDWNGTVSIQQLLIAGIDCLNKDRLALDQVSLSGRAAATHGRLAMHDLKLTTDVGEITATGDIPLYGLSKKSSVELVQSLLSDEDYHLNGRVDLKKMAVLLPQTLRIREGIEVTSGEVRVQFVGADIQGVRRWSGISEIAGLNAVRQGQRITWDKPIAARVNAHRDQKSIVVDLLECKSDFLQVAGKGTLGDALFTASGDLSKLLQNLERFVDLGIEQLAGQIKANGELKRTDNGRVALNSTVVLDNFAYVVSKDNVWREKRLELLVVAAGQVDATPTLTRIDTGEVHFNSGGDTFELILKQPIDLVSSAPVCVANTKLNGGITSWQNRLRPFASISDWRFAGTVNLATTMSANSHRVDVGQLTVGLRDLVAVRPGWMIKEPDVKLETTGSWDIQARKWTSPKVALESKSLSMEITNLEGSLGQQGVTALAGSAAYRADLVQLSGWKNLALQNPSYYLIGTLTGTANITQQDRQLSGKFDSQIEKLVVAGQGMGANGQPQWVALWKEPQLRLNGKGSYDVAKDSAALDSGQIDVDGMSVTASGNLGECSTNQRINLTGDLAYDWETLMNRFGPSLGQTIQISGKDHRPFSIKGSLAGVSGISGQSNPNGIAAAPVSFPSDNNTIAAGNSTTGNPSATGLTCQAGLGWNAVNVYGINAGAGELSGQLQQGVCRFAPLEIAVNDGKMRVTPTIYLDRNPLTLVLPQERLIDHVSLSREFCGNSIMFIVPMLSDSTHVEGRISVDMQGAVIPLNAIANGSGSGILTIHGARATHGTLASHIVGAIRQVRSIFTGLEFGNPSGEAEWFDMPDQQVPFKFEQGRIYHDGLTFMVSKVEVRTSGSVGLDNSLSLIAQIAIMEDWLGNNRMMAEQKGKFLHIPISGTTSRPRMDLSIFKNLTQKFGGSAIKGFLQDNIGGGLKGAFNNGFDQLLREKQ